jgi:hypothetical protein
VLASFAKVTAVLGAVALVGAGVGILPAGIMAYAALALLVAAIAGSVALEERDSVEGLVAEPLGSAGSSSPSVEDVRVSAHAA